MKIMGMDGSMMFFLVLVLLLAVIPARIAKGKGYNFGGFYAFGIFLWPVALAVSLIMRPKHTPQDLVAYKQLLDDGVISQEEFEAKKQDILGQ